MYHDGDKTTLEASDIAAALAAPELITLADGRQMLLVGLVINPASGKTYAAAEAPDKLHLTDGVQPRLLHFSPLLDILEPLDLALQAVAQPEMATETPGAAADEPAAAAETAPADTAALSNAAAMSAEPEATATDNAELQEEPSKEETPPEPEAAPAASEASAPAEEASA